ncbi:MAG TPA: hypothetical protein VHT30_03370 [Acidimicrobiales bacterium]|jgi:hypothetical protein|nr:hypothetical protein [Acidimicrobiales bacterium]
MQHLDDAQTTLAESNPTLDTADDPEGPTAGEDLADIEDLEDIADLEEGDLEDEDALDVDTIDADDDLDDTAVDTDEEIEDTVNDAEVAVEARPRKVPAADGAAEAETDDDELLADEVEASLDVILAERLRGEDLEEEEVEEDEEDDAPNQLATVIPVRQPDEFLCQSCFLLKPPGQLADRDHQLCRDCA